MIVVRRLFRRATALALVAMLGLALAPTISHALATRLVNVQPWSELCSVDGDGAAGAWLAHCSLCAPTGHGPALPGAAMTTSPLAQGPGVAPAGMPHGACVTAAAWVAPPSRAPPPLARA